MCIIGTLKTLALLGISEVTCTHIPTLTLQTYYYIYTYVLLHVYVQYLAKCPCMINIGVFRKLMVRSRHYSDYTVWWSGHVTAVSV